MRVYLPGDVYIHRCRLHVAPIREPIQTMLPLQEVRHSASEALTYSQRTATQPDDVI